MHLEAEGDILGDVHVGPEGVVLEDHARVAVFRGRVGDIPLAEEDAAEIGFGETGDEPQEGRLAAAGGAEDEEKLAGGNFDRDVVHGGEVAEAFRQVRECQRRHGMDSIRYADRCAREKGSGLGA